MSRLKKAEGELRSDHAGTGEVRELKGALATYANQIQILTLRTVEREEDNARLIAQLRQAGGNVTALSARETVTP